MHNQALAKLMARLLSLIILCLSLSACEPEKQIVYVSRGDGDEKNGGGGSTTIGSGGDGLSSGFINLGKAIANEISMLTIEDKPEHFTDEEWDRVYRGFNKNFINSIDVVMGDNAYAHGQPRDANNVCSFQNLRILLDRDRWLTYRTNAALYSEQVEVVTHEYLLCLEIEDEPGYRYTHSLLRKIRELRNTPVPIGAVPISSCEDLQTKLGPESGSTYGFYRVLTRDIDCSDSQALNDGDGFRPIEMTEGILDGADFKIIGLILDRTSARNQKRSTSNTAIFSDICSHCEVKNLSIQNAEIYGEGYRVAVLAAKNLGTIRNVDIIGADTFVSGTSRTAFAAGLVASNFGTISDANVHASVSVNYRIEDGLDGIPTPMSGRLGVGLIAGENARGSVLNNIEATGSVHGYEFVGGAIGYDAGDTAFFIDVNAKVSGWNVLGLWAGYGQSGHLGEGINVSGTVMADQRDPTKYPESNMVGPVLGKAGMNYVGWERITVDPSARVIPASGLPNHDDTYGGSRRGFGIRLDGLYLDPFRQ